MLLAFSVLLHNNPVVDLMGIGAGHLYFFLEDVYPQLEGGRRVLITPTFMSVPRPPFRIGSRQSLHG